MPVKEADPAAKSLDEAFAAAMDAPARPREAPPPPEVDKEAPHGRDEQGTPLAPFGHNQDGSVRKSRAGRSSRNKDDEARTTKDTPEQPSAPDAKLEPKDFSAGLMETGEGAWFAGSVLAKVGPQIPLIGRFVPGRKLAAMMCVFDAERPRLAAALNLAAQHDERARRLAEKLSTGEVGWALSCMFLCAPFAGAAAAIWQYSDKHDTLTERDLPSLDEMAKNNEEVLDRMFKRIADQMAAAQLAAQAMAAVALEQQMAAAA